MQLIKLKMLRDNMNNIITFEYSEVKYTEIFDEEHSIGTKYFKKFIKTVSSSIRI